MSRNKKIEQIEDETVEFNRQKTIKDGLSEIYQDDDGEIIDVKKLQIRPNKGWQWWLTTIGIYLAVVGLLAMGTWYWLRGRVDPLAVELSLSGPTSLVAGTDFEYIVKYKNKDKNALTDVYIKVEYPENFIFQSAEPAPTTGQIEWRLDRVEAGSEGQIVIKGQLINEVGKSNVATAEMYYSLESFSSEYKKVTTLDLPVGSTGLETVLVHDSSALVGETQKMVFKYKLKEDGRLNHFWLTIDPSDISQVEFINDDKVLPGVTMVKPWVWEITQAQASQQEVPISFKFIDKASDKYQFNLQLTYQEPSLATSTPPATSTATSSNLFNTLAQPAKSYVFYQEAVDYEVINNELNLSLVVNGSDQNQGINFGQTLNYSLSYANKGSKPIEDVMIMVVVDGNIVDWSSFKDKLKGQVNEGSVAWTKTEMPELASLAPGSQGIIDFSLRIKDFNQLGGHAFNQEITSYAKFSAKEAKTEPEQANNKSNTIVNKLNSDLLFQESLVYFSEDNIPLGSGPIPFAVGQATTVRGSWKILSSLHDLNNIQVSLKLPDYVGWAGKSKTSGGNLLYDATSRTITWRLAQLIVGQPAVTAEFDLSVLPQETQRRQLLVIMPKAQITAMDSVTNGQLSKEGKIKTSKLEDDPLISAGDLDNNGGLIK